MNRKMIAAVLLVAPSMAFAHPGHIDNFMTAFAHPFTGVDHLVMMLCVGIFAGRVGGNTRWQLPLLCMSAMTAGWWLGHAGVAFAGIDSGIAAGLIVLGVMFAWRVSLPLTMQMGIVALFALLHGIAHGVELQANDNAMVGSGFLFATALLHAGGLYAASLISARKTLAYRVLGVLLSVLGGGLLIA